MEYCEKIIESRQEEAAHLLPGLVDPDKEAIDSSSLNLPHLMIDKVLQIYWKQIGDGIQQMNFAFPFSLHCPSVYKTPVWKITEFKPVLRTASINWTNRINDILGWNRVVALLNLTITRKPTV